jgi:hypothetical protein
MHSVATTVSSNVTWRAILWAGLAAGVLDITAAFVVYGAFGARPMRILQGIAAGLLGPSSFGSHSVFPAKSEDAFSGGTFHPLRSALRNRRLLFHEPGRGAAIKREEIFVFVEDDADWHRHSHLLCRPADRNRGPQSFNTKTSLDSSTRHFRPKVPAVLAIPLF